MWFPWWLSGKESACQCKRCRRCEFDPGLGGSPGVENGNQLQYPYLENSMDKGVGQATVCGVTRSCPISLGPPSLPHLMPLGHHRALS